MRSIGVFCEPPMFTELGEKKLEQLYELWFRCYKNFSN